LKLKKHHKLIVSGVVVFVLAWCLWTFVWLPKAEVSAIEQPITAPAQ